MIWTMRVLFHSYSLAHQNPGGGERVMAELKISLTKLGLDVEFFQPWIHDPAEFDLFHYFSILESPFWRFLKNNYPKIPLVVTPTFYGGKSAAQQRLRQIKDVILVNCRDKDVSSIRDFTLPDLFLPTTKYEAESLTRRYGISPKKMQVVPNGISSIFFGNENTNYSKTTPVDKPFVLHVGRFHPVKRQDFLLRALRGSDITCVLVGDKIVSHPEYYESCVNLAKGQKNVHILSGIAANSPELIGLYANASLFVLPSAFETFGIAPLEAAAMGCPLLLSDQIVCPEIYRDEAEFLAIDDPSKWRNAILKKISRPKRLTYEQKLRIHSEFNWDRIAAVVAAEYASLLHRASR